MNWLCRKKCFVVLANFSDEDMPYQVVINPKWNEGFDNIYPTSSTCVILKYIYIWFSNVKWTDVPSFGGLSASV